MSIPSSGIVTLAMLASEFGGSPPYYLSQFYRGGGRVTSNNTGVPASGAISLLQFRGAQKVIPGAADYTTPGSYQFIIPAYQTLQVICDGGGGAGASLNGQGGNGGNSIFAGLVIGGLGFGGASSTGQANTGGAGGTTAGADSAANGNGGANGPNGSFGGAGGSGAGGGGGGAGGSTQSGTPGGAGGLFGGGGGGAGGGNTNYNGGGGGGARAVRTFVAGQLAVGTAVTVEVGVGGIPTNSPYGNQWNGGNGGSGRVYISWS